MDYLNPFGDEIKFDKNGDPAAMYDLVNWQLMKGEIKYVTIGKFDEMATVGKQILQIQEQNIVWNGNKTQVGILPECRNVELQHTLATSSGKPVQSNKSVSNLLY